MAFVQATEGFFDVSSGAEVFVAAGAIRDDGDPIVAAHADVFRPLEVESTPPPAPKPRAAKK